MKSLTGPKIVAPGTFARTCTVCGPMPSMSDRFDITLLAEGSNSVPSTKTSYPLAPGVEDHVKLAGAAASIVPGRGVVMRGAGLAVAGTAVGERATTLSYVYSLCATSP